MLCLNPNICLYKVVGEFCMLRELRKLMDKVHEMRYDWKVLAMFLNLCGVQIGDLDCIAKLLIEAARRGEGGGHR